MVHPSLYGHPVQITITSHQIDTSYTAVTIIGIITTGLETITTGLGTITT